MSLTAFLEALAYALARGAVRAYLDVKQERSTAIEETPNAKDVARAAAVRAALDRVLVVAPAAAGAPRPVDPARGVP